MANAKPRLQVVIATPAPKSATLLPQNAPAPPDHYTLLQHTIKRDGNKVIAAVLKYPWFAEATLGICATARAFPGTPANHAQFLGSFGWVCPPLSLLVSFSGCSLIAFL